MLITAATRCNSAADVGGERRVRAAATGAKVNQQMGHVQQAARAPLAASL
jgi:hypothetical protein